MKLWSDWSNPAGIRTRLRFYTCPDYQQADEVPIKNKWASLETPFSHYKSMENFSDAQGQLTP